MSGSALATTRPTAAERREAFRAGLTSGRLLRMPGAFSPLVAMAVEDAGFENVYVSRAALSADLGLPDVGLTTLSEVAGRGAQIARSTSLPTLIDADTGFGEAMNVARTIQALEDAGRARPRGPRRGHPPSRALRGRRGRRGLTPRHWPTMASSRPSGRRSTCRCWPT